MLLKLILIDQKDFQSDFKNDKSQNHSKHAISLFLKLKFSPLEY